MPIEINRATIEYIKSRKNSRVKNPTDFLMKPNISFNISRNKFIFFETFKCISILWG
jgi:hypothetical protein